MVDAVFVEERGAFFVDLAAGEKKVEVGGESEVDVDLVAKFAGKSEKSGVRGLR